MRSLLEHEPELIERVGLITVRWSALESELADLLGTLMRAREAGERAYFSVGSFGQRADLVEAATLGSLASPNHRRVAAAIFKKIKTLWKTRNYLVHGNYVFTASSPQGHSLALTKMGRKLREGPIFGERMVIMITPDETEIPLELTTGGYAYEKWNIHGVRDYVPVNKGTYDNHALQVMKRSGQIRRLASFIEQEIAPLDAPSSLRGTPHPRSHKDQSGSPRPPAEPPEQPPQPPTSPK